MFGIKRKKTVIKAPDEVAGVRVRASARARRMALRMDARTGDVVLTWPRGASETKAAQFIEANRNWIETQRRQLPQAQIFAEGETVPLYGRDVTIIRRDGRGLTRLEGDKLIVHGQPQHLPRRVKDFLKETARQVFEDTVPQKLERIGRKQAHIRVIDPKTRWGSCSPEGDMMFSWRLILTPPWVLDYVVAHEVAHCIHMNHSKKFWALCASLTDADAGAARRWLRRHGTAVMSYQ